MVVNSQLKKSGKTNKLCRSASEKSENDTIRLYINILFQKIILCTSMVSIVPNNLPTDDTDIPILLVVLLVYHNK